MSTMFRFGFLATIYMCIGVIVYVLSEEITEFNKRYDDVPDCKLKLRDNTQCKVPLGLVENVIEKPVYVYYQLDNFYQNHRRYVKSRDNEQLYGKYKRWEELSSCDPIIQVKHLWPNQKTNLNGNIMNDEDPAIPCGLVAKSVFNDTFELWLEGDKSKNQPDQNITIF